MDAPPFPLDRLEEPYLLWAKYLNPRSGNDVRLYLRGYDPLERRHHSTFLDIQDDYTIQSQPLDQQELYQLLSGLNADPRLSSFRFSLFPYGSKYLILARTPEKKKEHCKLLGEAAASLVRHPRAFGNPSRETPSDDSHNRNPNKKPKMFSKNTFLYDSPRFSPSIYLNATFKPLGLLNREAIVDGKNQRERYIDNRRLVSIDHLTHDVHLIIDIETENWDAPDLEDIISLVIVTPTVDWLPATLFTRYEPPAEELAGARIRMFADHEDLGCQLEALVEELDPLGLVGYNLKFDFIQQLRRVCPDLRLGVDDSRIKIRATGGKTESHAIGGRFVHDLYLVASQQMSYLPSQKLDELIEHFDIGDKKRYNYFELAKALKEKDPGAYLYTIEDGFKTRDLFNTLKEELYRDALFLRVVPEGSQKSFASASERATYTWHFSKHRTIPNPKRFSRRRDQFDPDAEERLWYGIPPLTPVVRNQQTHELLTEEHPIKYPRQNGVFKNAAWFFPTLIVKSFEPLYRASHYHQQFWYAYRDHHLVKHRYRGLWKLRELILRDVIAYQDACLDFQLDPFAPFPEIIPDRINSANQTIPFENYDWYFVNEHGHGEVHLRDLNTSIVETVETWRSLFSEEAWLNYSNGFLLVRGDEARALSERQLGVILTEGGALSNGPFFAMRNGPTLYTQGVSLFRRDKPRWAWDLIRGLLLEACDQAGKTGTLKPRSLEAMIATAGASIISGKTPRSELLFNGPKGGPTIIGYLGNDDVQHEEFLSSDRKPAAERYVYQFRKKWYPDLVSFLLTSNVTQQSLLF